MGSDTIAIAAIVNGCGNADVRLCGHVVYCHLIGGDAVHFFCDDIVYTFMENGVADGRES